MIVGVFVPQGWKMELAAIRDAQDKWSTTVAVARRCEQLGVDSVWVYDHFHNVPVPAHEAVFECWTTLAAISQQTSRVRLGQMVSCAPYRNPALVAKITSSLDVISGGRLEWGIGAGWYDNEFTAYGYEFASAKERIEFLEDTVRIVRAMWTESEPVVEGRHASIDRPHCEPKPLQTPHPPIWIGGGGEQLTLRVVARHATHSNFGGKLHEWCHKRDVLLRHCDDVGRDPADITMTWSPELFIRPTEEEIVAAGSRSFWGEPFESWRQGNLVGTPEQVVEKLAAYRDEGLGGVVVWPSDLPDLRSVELLMSEVVPQLGERAAGSS